MHIKVRINLVSGIIFLIFAINDTKDQWRMQISKDTWDLDPNPFAINLKNGIYNILEDTLFEHTSDYLSITQLNARFDKEEGSYASG